MNPSTTSEHAANRDADRSVIITDQLNQRSYRGPNYKSENEALVALMEALATAPESVLTLLVRKAIELCGAHSAGVSIEEGTGPDAVFRWRAVAGQWERFNGGSLPRYASPCATVLEHDRPLLMNRLELSYDLPAELRPPVEEVLLVPFRSAADDAGVSKAVGTVWIVSHDAGRRFDREDLRLMESLAAFAGAAYQALSRATTAETN